MNKYSLLIFVVIGIIQASEFARSDDSSKNLEPRTKSYNGIGYGDVVLTPQGIDLIVTEVYEDGRFTYGNRVTNDGIKYFIFGAYPYDGNLNNLPVKLPSEKLDTEAVYLNSKGRRVRIVSRYTHDIVRTKDVESSQLSKDTLLEKLSNLAARVTEYRGIKSGDPVLTADIRRIIVREIYSDGRFTHDLPLRGFTTSGHAPFHRNAVFNGNLNDMTPRHVATTCPSLFASKVR